MYIYIDRDTSGENMTINLIPWIKHPEKGTATYARDGFTFTIDLADQPIVAEFSWSVAKQNPRCIYLKHSYYVAGESKCL